jgi:hypothetical protein
MLLRNVRLKIYFLNYSITKRLLSKIITFPIFVRTSLNSPSCKDALIQLHCIYDVSDIIVTICWQIKIERLRTMHTHHGAYHASLTSRADVTNLPLQLLDLV